MKSHFYWRIWDFFSEPFFWFGAILFLSLGCAQKQEEPANAGFSPTQISVSHFQGATAGDWLLDSNGYLLTKESTLSFKGVCGPRIVSIRLSINGTPVSPNVSCDSNAIWTYSGAFGLGDGTYPLVFEGVDSSGAVDSSTTISHSIVKDTTPPSLVAITFPVTEPTVFNSPAPAVINGTFTGDVFSMVSSDGGTNFSINTGGGTFTYTTFINSGETRVITLKARDKAGNESGTLTATFTRVGDFDSLAIGIHQFAGVSVVSMPMNSAGYHLHRTSFDSMGSEVQSNGGYDLSLGFTQQVMRY